MNKSIFINATIYYSLFGVEDGVMHPHDIVQRNRKLITERFPGHFLGYGWQYVFDFEEDYLAFVMSTSEN